MSSKKERRKARKNTDRLIDDAYDALDSGHEALAEKLAQRAIEAGAMNPRVWCDQGRILERLGRRAQAERAYRNAVSLAPSYAEAHASLAALLASAGRFAEAVAAQKRAVSLEPRDKKHGDALATYAAMAPATEGELVEEEAFAGGDAPIAGRTLHLCFEEIEAQLLRQGGAVLPGLLDTAECAELRGLWNDHGRFEHSVSLDDGHGKVAYGFFARPLPAVVRELREEVYARSVPIANRYNERVGKEERYPINHAAFLAQCRRAGQSRTTPILLRYARDGWNGYHRDVFGDIAYPIQLAVSLGPEPGASGGGDLLLLDQRPGRRRVHTFRTDPGDGVLFCSRDRLVRIAGMFGLQPVLHAVTSVTAAERFALGIPFHDYVG